MELSNFNKKELLFIENILKITNEIKNIYDKLYNLEIKQLKNTNIYLKQLEILKKAIEKENILYQQSNLTIEKYFKIIEFLTNTPNFKKTNDIHSIIEQDNSNIIIRRIINNLIRHSINNPNYPNKLEISNLFKDLGIEDDNNQLIKDINNHSKIEIAINDDINLLFISILKDSTLINKNILYKDKLNKAIYNTIFINKNLEKTLFEYNFDIPNKIYISSKLINEILITNYKMYNIITNLIVQTQINKHIIEVLIIKDYEYDNPKTYISSIINQCYIRTLLTFLSDNNIYKLNEEFHNLIDSETYISNYQDNNISEKAIIKCFKNINNDKTKKLTITLNQHNIN